MSASAVMWRRTVAWSLFAGGALAVAVLLLAAGREAHEVARRSPLVPSEVHAGPRVRFRADADAAITGAMAERAGMLFLTTAAPELLAFDRRGRISLRLPLPAKSAAGVFIPQNGSVFGVLDDGRVFKLVDHSLRLVGHVGGPVDTPLGADRDGAWVASEHALVRIDASGQMRARFESWGKIAAAPAVGTDRTAFVGSQDHHAYAVRSDGSLVFRFDTGSDVDATPAVDAATDESFFANAGGRVVALSPAGALRWERFVDGPVRASVVLEPSGRVVVATLGPRPKLTWFARESGKKLGEVLLPLTDGPEHGVTFLSGGGGQGTVASTPDGFALGCVSPSRAAWSLRVRGEVSAVRWLTDRAEWVVADRGGLVQVLAAEGAYSLLPKTQSL